MIPLTLGPIGSVGLCLTFVVDVPCPTGLSTRSSSSLVPGSSLEASESAEPPGGEGDGCAGDLYAFDLDSDLVTG